MLTDNEVVQDAAIMKDQLSLPGMSESPLDTTKKTSSQKLLDEKLEDLPTGHYEHDEIKAGHPITDLYSIRHFEHYVWMGDLHRRVSSQSRSV